MEFQLPSVDESSGENNCSNPIYFSDLESGEFVVISPTTTRATTIAALYACIFAVGLITNIALLYALLRGGKRGATFKAPSTILIANLAIADSLLLLTLPFAIVQRLENHWKFGLAFCKVEETLKFLNYYGSVFFLTTMAGDRYYSLFHATNYDRSRARRKLFFVSLSVWLLALLVAVPIMVFSGIDQYGFCNIIFPGTEINLEYIDPEGSSKHFDSPLCLDEVNGFVKVDDDFVPEIAMPLQHDSTSATSSPENAAAVAERWEQLESYQCIHPAVKSVGIWLTCNFVVGFVLPFIAILGCYIKILRLKATASAAVSQSSDNMQATEANAQSATSSPKSKSLLVLNKKAKKILDILIPCLILIFILCWLPYHAWHLAKVVGIDVSVETCDWISDITFVLAFSNSAFNPILNSLFLFNIKTRLEKSVMWLKKLTHMKTTANSEMRTNVSYNMKNKSYGLVAFDRAPDQEIGDTETGANIECDEMAVHTTVDVV